MTEAFSGSEIVFRGTKESDEEISYIVHTQQWISKACVINTHILTL